MRFRSRIARLEDRQRRQHRPGEQHFTSMITVPQTVPHDAWLDWLSSQPCACGKTSFCPERRVGALLPEKCENAEIWASHYGLEEDS
jgi:hypothetical protein